jgi:hypothetical protein
LLDDSAAWRVALVIVALATIGSFGGSMVTARLARTDSSAFGSLMNNRGVVDGQLAR